MSHGWLLPIRTHMSYIRTRAKRNQTLVSSLTHSNKVKIRDLIARREGLSGRQIASRLGLEKVEVNRFLHGEGNQNFGLVQRNWKWYLNEYIQPQLSISQTEPAGDNAPSAPIPPTRSMCGTLLTLNELSAILQIRRLDLLAVEKAFSEDEYTDLPDALKIELGRRLAELNEQPSSRPLPRQHPNGVLHFLAYGLSALALVTLGAKIVELLSRS